MRALDMKTLRISDHTHQKLTNEQIESELERYAEWKEQTEENEEARTRTPE